MENSALCQFHLQRLGGVQEYLIDGTRVVASENKIHLFAATKVCYANQLWDNAYIQQDIVFIFLIKGSMINGLFARELDDKFYRTERELLWNPLQIVKNISRLTH